MNMSLSDKFSEASGEFLEFIHEGTQEMTDTNMIEDSGELVPLFGQMIKAIDIIERAFPEFYGKYKTNVWVLFYENLRVLNIMLELLIRLTKENAALLPYPDYVKIQIAELERYMLPDAETEEYESKMEELKAALREK